MHHHPSSAATTGVLPRHPIPPDTSAEAVLLREARHWEPPPSGPLGAAAAATWRARLHRAHAAYTQAVALLYPAAPSRSATARTLRLVRGTTNHRTVLADVAPGATRWHSLTPRRLWDLLQAMRRRLPAALLAEHPLEHPSLRHDPPARPEEVAAAAHATLQAAARHGWRHTAKQGRAGAHLRYSQLRFPDRRPLAMPRGTEYIMLWADDDLEGGGRGLSSLATDVLWLWAAARALETRADDDDAITMQSVRLMVWRLAVGVRRRAAAVRQALQPGTSPPPLPFLLASAEGWTALWRSTRRDGWRWTQTLPATASRYSLEAAPEGRRWGVALPAAVAGAALHPSSSRAAKRSNRGDRGDRGNRGARDRGMHASGPAALERWQQAVWKEKGGAVSQQTQPVASLLAVRPSRGITIMDAAVLAVAEGVPHEALEHAAATTAAAAFDGAPQAAPVVAVLATLEAAAAAVEAAAAAAGSAAPEEEDAVAAQTPLLPAHIVLGVQVRGKAAAALQRAEDIDSLMTEDVAAEEAVATQLAGAAPTLALALRGHLLDYMLRLPGTRSTTKDNLFHMDLPVAVRTHLSRGITEGADAAALQSLRPLMATEEGSGTAASSAANSSSGSSAASSGGSGGSGSSSGGSSGSSGASSDLEQLRKTAQQPLCLARVAAGMGVSPRKAQQQLVRQVLRQGRRKLPLLPPRDVAAVPMWTEPVLQGVVPGTPSLLKLLKEDFVAAHPAALAAVPATVPQPPHRFTTSLEAVASGVNAVTQLAPGPLARAGVLLPVNSRDWRPAAGDGSGGRLTAPLALPTQAAPTLAEVLAAAAAAAELDWESLRRDGRYAPLAGSVFGTVEEAAVPVAAGADAAARPVPLPWVNGRGQWAIGGSLRVANVPGWTASLPCPPWAGACVLRAVQGMAAAPADAADPATWHTGLVLQPPLLVQHPPCLYPQQLLTQQQQLPQQHARAVALTAAGATSLVAALLPASPASSARQLALVRTVWRVLLARVLLGAALLHGRATPVVLPLRTTLLGTPPAHNVAAADAWHAMARAQLAAWHAWWTALLPPLQPVARRGGVLLRCSLGEALDALLPLVLPPPVLAAAAADAAAAAASPTAPWPSPSTSPATLARSRLARLARLLATAAYDEEGRAAAGAITRPLLALTSTALPGARVFYPLLKLAGMQLALAAAAAGGTPLPAFGTAGLKLLPPPAGRVAVASHGFRRPRLLAAGEWEGDWLTDGPTDEEQAERDELYSQSAEPAEESALPLRLPPGGHERPVHMEVAPVDVLTDWDVVEDGEEGRWVGALALRYTSPPRSGVDITQAAVDGAAAAFYWPFARRMACRRVTVVVHRPLWPLDPVDVAHPPLATMDPAVTVAGLWAELRERRVWGALEAVDLQTRLVVLRSGGRRPKLTQVATHSVAASAGEEAWPVVGAHDLPDSHLWKAALHRAVAAAGGGGGWDGTLVVQVSAGGWTVPALACPPIAIEEEAEGRLRLPGVRAVSEGLREALLQSGEGGHWRVGSVPALLFDPWAPRQPAAGGNGQHPLPAMAAAMEAGRAWQLPQAPTAPAPLGITLHMSLLLHRRGTAVQLSRREQTALASRAGLSQVAASAPAAPAPTPVPRHSVRLQRRTQRG